MVKGTCMAATAYEDNDMEMETGMGMGMGMEMMMVTGMATAHYSEVKPHIEMSVQQCDILNFRISRIELLKHFI